MALAEPGRFDEGAGGLDPIAPAHLDGLRASRRAAHRGSAAPLSFMFSTSRVRWATSASAFGRRRRTAQARKLYEKRSWHDLRLARPLLSGPAWLSSTNAW